MSMLVVNWIVFTLIVIHVDRSLTAPQQSNFDIGSQGDNTDEEHCVCVPDYLCDEDDKVITDGSGLIDPKKRVVPHELPLDGKYVPPDCGPAYTCCGTPISDGSYDYKHRCGGRNPNGIEERSFKVPLSDGETAPGEWPHQALVLKKSNNDLVYACGGTLIDETHILTAAHCVDNFINNETNLVIRLGDWDITTDKDIYPHEDHAVEDIVLHPEYRKQSLFNDIAVMELVEPVKFKPHVDTICLPYPADDFTGQTCVVTGWGKDLTAIGGYSKILKEVGVPILSNNDCQSKLRKTRLGKYFKLHDGFLCAGGKEKEDACKGDGGGPLICYTRDGTYSLVGLVSWGIGCGAANVPGVYVDVRKHVDWIASVTDKPLNKYRNN